MQDFVEAYGDFYYVSALDGHEAGEAELALLKKYEGLCRLHQAVQNDVVDIVFLGDERDRQQYLAAGRIDEFEARSRLSLMAQKYRLIEGLQRLVERTPHPVPLASH